jgi:glutathione S-transferase
MADTGLTFYHASPSRSSAVLLLLEELGVPYELHLLSLKNEENRQPAYLAVNPMGKVPALRHNGAVITETVAIFLYLADLFPEKGLAPAIGDPLRGPYVRWMVFYAACFEPALVDRAAQRDPGKRAMSPYGDYDSVINAILGQLGSGPWLLGDRFTAADVLWGSAFAWTTGFGLVRETPEMRAYIDRLNARLAIIRGREKDKELAAGQA